VSFYFLLRANKRVHMAFHRAILDISIRLTLNDCVVICTTVGPVSVAHIIMVHVTVSSCEFQIALLVTTVVRHAELIEPFLRLIFTLRPSSFDL